MDPETFRKEPPDRRLTWYNVSYPPCDPPFPELDRRLLRCSDRYPVLSRASRPGEIRRALPASAPEYGESFDAILADFERVLLPGITHWNHPGFFAYFAITGSAPGVLAEFLSAGAERAGDAVANVASGDRARRGRARVAAPADRPARFVRRRHLRHRVDLDAACARGRAEVAVPDVRARPGGPAEIARLRVYCSEHAHSSVDKAVILLGLGQDALRIQADEEFRMRAGRSRRGDRRGSRRGLMPIAVVATVGTTSATSVDPVGAWRRSARASVWLHVDAAYAGVAAMLPGICAAGGRRRADSVVVNPHKWLFTPFDLSVLYCRRMDAVRAAFSLTPSTCDLRER